jgi:hypothetical protein
MQNRNKFSTKKRKRQQNLIKNPDRNFEDKKIKHFGGFKKLGKNKKSNFPNNKQENANEEFKNLLMSAYNMEDYNNANESQNQELFSKSQDLKKSASILEKEHSHIFGASSRKERRREGKSKNHPIQGNVDQIKITSKLSNNQEKNGISVESQKFDIIYNHLDKKKNLLIQNINMTQTQVKINSLLGRKLFNYIIMDSSYANLKNKFTTQDYKLENSRKNRNNNTFLAKIQEFNDLYKNKQESKLRLERNKINHLNDINSLNIPPKKIKFNIDLSILGNIINKLDIENSKNQNILKNIKEDLIFNEDIDLENLSQDSKLNFKLSQANETLNDYEYNYTSLKEIKLSTLLQK